MRYVRKEVFSDDMLGDADALMREFYRAQGAIHDIDQDMIADTVVNPGHLVRPSASLRGATVTHDSGGSLLAVQTNALTISSVETTWVSNATPVSFTSYAQGRFRVIADGQYSGGVGPAKFDVRVIVDGRPGRVVTFSLPDFGAAAPDCGFFIDDSFLLTPGAHEAYVQVRERSAAAGSVSEVDLYVIGIVR